MKTNYNNGRSLEETFPLPVELLDLIDAYNKGDVVPVVHAHWEYRYYWRFKCSNCGGISYDKTYYCSDCGAKMDKEEVE